jgi:hypothetical protein
MKILAHNSPIPGKKLLKQFFKISSQLFYLDVSQQDSHVVI